VWDRLPARESTVDDRTEFARFVETHLRFVFRVAYAVLRNSADAEDVAQDVFLKLYRKQTWKGVQDERGYLARATWRLCMDRQSSARFSKSGEREFACPSNDPEAVAIENQRHERIHRLIDALPEKLRRPLALSAIEEMTTARIAEAMHLPEGTVRRRIAEARALLRDKILRMKGTQL
jgi:RNA polymerase sigma-70 factor (ECF subfamily)